MGARPQVPAPAAAKRRQERRRPARSSHAIAPIRFVLTVAADCAEETDQRLCNRLDPTMNKRHFATSLALLPLLGTTGCSVFSGADTGLAGVDDLLGWIERVHVESEMSKERAHAAIDALRTIAATNFAGDPVAAYAELTQTIDHSLTQANALRSAVQSMKNTAEPVFERWSSDLLSFTSAQMRQRSQTRLENTRSRYRSILAAVEPAVTSYDAFNNGLRDMQLFLGNDFNRQSVDEIRDDVRGLTNLTGELDRRFDQSLLAAQDYIDSASLPAAAEPAPAPSGAAPNGKPAGR